MLALAAREWLESPTEQKAFVSSGSYANQDKPYEFKVPSDGAMMRLEVTGTVPMNNWKAFDIEIFDDKGQYLFSYHDELWSESGYDSDGSWTERRRRAFLEQRFPKQGHYTLYFNDSSKTNKRTATTRFHFRVVPIRGDGSMLTPVIWISAGVAIVCFILLSNRLEQEKNKPMRYRPPAIKKSKPDSFPLPGILALFVAPVIMLTLFAYADDDDDINWITLAHYHNNISVDRELRQQSMSGPGFRSGTSRGGK